MYEKRPSCKLLSGADKWLAFFLLLRGAFMILKGLAFVLKSIQVGLLYKKTYKQSAQFETIFLLISAIKIIVLIPNVFIYEINWIFYVLVLNSALAYTLSFELRRRTTTLLNMDKKAKTCSKVWFIARMCLLMFIIASTFVRLDKVKSNHFFLTCLPIVYRKST